MFENVVLKNIILIASYIDNSIYSKFIYKYQFALNFLVYDECLSVGYHRPDKVCDGAKIHWTFAWLKCG